MRHLFPLSLLTNEGKTADSNLQSFLTKGNQTGFQKGERFGSERNESCAFPGGCELKLHPASSYKVSF